MARIIAQGRVPVTKRQLIRDFGTCLNNGLFAGVTNCGTINLSVGALTLSAWIKPLAFQTVSPYIMQIAGVEVGAVVAILRVGNGTLGTQKRACFALRFGSILTIQGVTDLIAEKWYHIVGVYNGETKKIYVNGVEDGSSAQTGTTTANHTFKIGTDGADGRRFAGFIDDVRVYKRALSPDEVEDFYYGKEPDPASFTNHWKFDEGSGTTALDSKGSNNATIAGATYSTNVFMKPRTLQP